MVMPLNQYILHLSSFKKVRMTGSLAITRLLERERERVSTSIFGTLYSTTEESEKSERRLIVPLKQGTTCPKIPSDDEK